MLILTYGIIFFIPKSKRAVYFTLVTTLSVDDSRLVSSSDSPKVESVPG